VIVDLKQRKGEVNPFKVSLVSFFTWVVFLLAGEGILYLFGVNVSSFAVTSSIVIFVLAAEMIFDVKIISTQGDTL
jgi:multiple antibiotic resistance protein